MCAESARRAGIEQVLNDAWRIKNWNCVSERLVVGPKRIAKLVQTARSILWFMEDIAYI